MKVGPQRIADALQVTVQDLDEFCRRQTGKTLEQWDEMFRERRAKAAAIRAIRSDRPLTHARMMDWMRRYGFQPQDFDAKVISPGALRNFEPGFAAPVDGKTGKQAETVIVWFLKPDVIPT